MALIRCNKPTANISTVAVCYGNSANVCCTLYSESGNQTAVNNTTVTNDYFSATASASSGNITALKAGKYLVCKNDDPFNNAAASYSVVTATVNDTLYSYSGQSNHSASIVPLF